ncbi:MAG: TonB-dependent receptor [Alphaproteobacteria bacterium]
MRTEQKPVWHRQLFVGTILAAGVAVALPAYAQEADVEAAAEAEADSYSGPKLDEIVVTAQKRAEDVQDVPLSVSAIGGEALKEKNIANLEQVADNVPNLHIEAAPTFNYIYMRGIGSGYNRGFEQSVATIIDEVFYGRPSYLSNGMLDLYAIEVLRGPQGTLFGKNSAAGVVHMRTVDPEPEWAFDGDVMYGMDNHYRIRTAFQGPLITDDLSFRVALLREERDGLTFNTTLGKDEENVDNVSARIKLLWEPTSTLSIKLAATGNTVNQGGSGQQLLKILPRHRAAMEVFDDQVNDSFTDDRSHTDVPGFVDRDTWDTTMTVNWDIGEYTLTNVLNYAQMDEDVAYDADFSPIKFLQLDNNENYDQISQELRLTSPPGTIEFVTGLYYYANHLVATFDITDFLTVVEIGNVTGQVDQQYDNALLGTQAALQIQLRQTLDGGAAQETSTTLFDQESESFAIFGQGTWHITDDFGLTLGLRGTMETKDLVYDHRLFNNLTGGEGEVGPTNPLGAQAFPVIQSGNVQFAATRERKEYDVSPKASLAYQWNDDIMTYLTYAVGFKSGGFNAQALNESQLEYEEENSVVYEAGIKSELFYGAMRLNVSVFLSDYQDLQTTAFDGVTFVVTNAASATIQGIEVDGAFLPMENLMLTFSGSYTDATFDSFPTGPCPAEDNAQFPNFLIGFVQSPPPCDLAGERLVNVPKVTLNMDAAYDVEFGNSGINLHIGGGVNYQTEQFMALDHDRFDVRPETVVFSARVGLRQSEGAWQVMIHGTNLTDVEEIYTTADVPTFVGSHFGTPFPERRVTGEVRVQF